MLTNSQGLRVKEKEGCLSVEEALQPFRGGVFPKSRKSPWSGLWLRRGSASSLLDVVAGTWGDGPAAAGDVGKAVISMLSVIHPHGPWGPIFRLVCLPRKGQAQVSQKLEAHTLGLSHRNDEEMQAGSNQGLPTLRSRPGGGKTFSACLKIKSSN